MNSTFHSNTPPYFFTSSRQAGDGANADDQNLHQLALILASLSVGESHLKGISNTPSTQATISTLRMFGAHINHVATDHISVSGVGVGGLLQSISLISQDVCAFSTQMIISMISTHAISATFADHHFEDIDHLRSFLKPLSLMGMRFFHDATLLRPISIVGANPAVPLDYQFDNCPTSDLTAFAIAALNVAGITRLRSIAPLNDDHFRLFKIFGADISAITNADGSNNCTIVGEVDLQPQTIQF